MKTISEVLKNNVSGLCYGNRILLPFEGIVLKLVIEKNLLRDFSPSSDTVYINQTNEFLEIYFKEYDSLKNSLSKYETIKMVIVEKGSDVFDFQNHKKIALHILENHKVKIEEITDDILFIE